MAEQIDIIELQGGDGKVKYPITTSDAVGMPDGSGNITEKLHTLEGQKANKTDIPTSTSELNNDSGFLTEHQDISGKLDKDTYNKEKASFATKNEVKDKVDKVPGKELSDQNFTKQEKEKLAGIEAGAVSYPEGGYNRKEYEGIGLIYNGKSGFYEKDGLLDITEGDAALIFLDAALKFPTSGYKQDSRSRINISVGFSTPMSKDEKPYFLRSRCEIVVLIGSNSLLSNYNNFEQCASLVSIKHLEIGQLVKSDWAFYRCYKLKQCVFTQHFYDYQNIPEAIIMKDCPKWNYYSIFKTIDRNAKKKRKFTLIVNPITYDYLNGIKYEERLIGGKINVNYDVNRKTEISNIYWSEERGTKGLDGEFVYPSLLDYSAAHPGEFATSADWMNLVEVAKTYNISFSVP